jgi:NACHT domain
MSDPLSITASITAVLKLTTTVLQYLHDAKGAFSECDRLYDEVNSASAFLVGLQAMVDRAAGGETWLATTRLLGGANGPLEKFRSALELLSKRLKPVVGIRKAGTVLMWPFRKGEILEILNAVERQKTSFLYALQNDHLLLSRNIEADVTDIKQFVQAIDKGCQEDLERTIIEWLSTIEPEKKHHDIQDLRMSGTGQWLLENQNFIQWRDGISPQKILWCHGIPGAGKTVLLSLVVDNLRCRFAGQNVGIAFFYCDYRDQDRQTTPNILTSLLQQLITHTPSMPLSVQELYKRYKNDRGSISLADLEETISMVLKEFKQSFILIDALDECDVNRHRKSFIQVLKRLEERSVRVFITSRPHPDDIQRALSPCSQICITASDSDIRRYLNELIDLDDAATSIIDEALKEDIVTEIVGTAQGM